MINLYDMIYAPADTCEAFQDRRIYQAWKSLKDRKITWDKVFGMSNVHLQWDKIGKDQIEEIDKEGIDDFIKRARRIKAGKPGERKVVVFGFSNEKLLYIFDPLYTEIYRQMYGISSWAWYSPTNSMHKLKVDEVYSEVKKADYLLVVYADVNTANQLRQDRVASQSGMIRDLTYDDHHSKHTLKGEVGKSTGGLDTHTLKYNSYYAQCLDIARAAEKQRKDIIAQNKFKRDSDTSEIDKIVEDATKLFTKFSMWATKHPNDITTYDFSRISQLVTDRAMWSPGNKDISTKDGILAVYTRYCINTINIQADKQYIQTYVAVREKDSAEIQNLYKELIESCSQYSVKL